MLTERAPLEQSMAPRGKARAEWRQLLRDLEVRPSKRMGQNFLVDQGCVERIVDVAALRPGATVVEVGPGLGILTRALLEAVGPDGQVIAVELDRRLAAYLRGVGGAGAALHIVEGDILRQSLSALVPNGDAYAVIANLPYNITSAALRYFLDSPRRPESLVVMVQEEVARRIVAAPPEMSILAVAVQFYSTSEIAFTVNRDAFAPPPNVDSAVLRIVTRTAPPLPPDQATRFFTMVHAGFAQRRKQLSNSLAARLAAPKDALVPALTAASIDPAARAETLTVADWLRLFNVLRARELV